MAKLIRYHATHSSYTEKCMFEYIFCTDEENHRGTKEKYWRLTPMYDAEVSQGLAWILRFACIAVEESTSLTRQ